MKSRVTNYAGRRRSKAHECAHVEPLHGEPIFNLSSRRFEDCMTEAERIAIRMMERPEPKPHIKPPVTIRRFSWEDET